MGKHLTRILILADLEGSCACWSVAASSFLTDEMDQLYLALIKLCYFTPLTARILPLSLMGFNLRGRRLGIMWARRTFNSAGLSQPNK